MRVFRPLRSLGVPTRFSRRVHFAQPRYFASSSLRAPIRSPIKTPLRIPFVRYFSPQSNVTEGPVFVDPSKETRKTDRQFETKSKVKDDSIKPQQEFSHSEKVLRVISNLTQLGIQIKSFPVITCIAPQSFGKSSAVESLSKMRLVLPKGQGMATLKPIYIAQIKSQTDRYLVNDKEVSQSGAADEIERLNANRNIKAINVMIYSSDPDTVNSYYCDLPGLISLSNVNPDLPEHFKKLCYQHIENPNTIPVIVHSASADPETNKAIQIVTKLGRTADAIGIITKIDECKKQKKLWMKLY